MIIKEWLTHCVQAKQVDYTTTLERLLRIICIIKDKKIERLKDLKFESLFKNSKIESSQSTKAKQNPLIRFFTCSLGRCRSFSVVSPLFLSEAGLVLNG